MHTEGIQNIPKLNVRPSFKIKREKNAKNIACNLTKFKELKGLELTTKPEKYMNGLQKQHLENCISEISTLWAIRRRHFTMTNKLKHLNVKIDYIMHNKVE